MFKKILIASLAGVVIVAAAFSLYNAYTVSAAQAGQPAQAALQAGAQVVGAAAQAAGVPAVNDPAAAFSPQANAGGGNAWGRSQNRAANVDPGSRTVGEPNPQNGLTEWVTYSGTVTAYSGAQFTLVTADGQSIPAEPGNISYQSEIGLALQDGEAVTVTGFWDANGGLALGSLTLDSTGETFTFRDELGRPLWSGARGNGNRGGNGGGGIGRP